MRTTDNLLSNVYLSCFELNFLERHHDVIKQKTTMNSEKLHCVPTLCDPVDCSFPGSSVHGILQARILEWVAISFSRGSSWPRDWTSISCIGDGFLTIWATREAQTMKQRMNQSRTQIHSPFLKTLELRIGVCVWKKMKKDQIRHRQQPIALLNIDSLPCAFTHWLKQVGKSQRFHRSNFRIRVRSSPWYLLRFRQNSLSIYYAVFPTLFC